MSPAFSHIPLPHLWPPRPRTPSSLTPRNPPLLGRLQLCTVPQGPQPSFCLLSRSPTCPGCACRTPHCLLPGPARMKRRGSGRAPRWRCPTGRPTAWSQGLASCTERQVGDPALTQPGTSPDPGHPCAPSPPRSRPTDAAARPQSRVLAYGCVFANTCLCVCSVAGVEASVPASGSEHVRCGRAHAPRRL